MKTKIFARQNIINPRTEKRHDDKGLFALDGICDELVNSDGKSRIKNCYGFYNKASRL